MTLNTSRVYDVLVAGEINPDLILSGGELVPRFEQEENLVDHMELSMGSSSAIFACGAARLGLRVAFVGVVGADLFGRFMLEALQERGVDVSHVIVDPAQKTGMSVILNRGADRSILTYPGAIGALRADQVSTELLQNTRHLHVASYFLQPDLRPGLSGLFAQAHHLGVSTSLDTNWDPQGTWEGVINLLPLVDVFLPNQMEALSLTGATTPQQAITALSQKANCVVVKLGRQGAIARQGAHSARCGSLRIDVADTVGAGDSFDAGFVYGYLKGWNLEKALSMGAVCGSLSTRSFGGTTAQATLPEAETALRQISE